jgi:hypothetical protein
VSRATGPSERRPQIRSVFCKQCLIRERQPEGIPLGWYYLTVTVPRWVNPKGFIAVGLFCTPACLAAYQPEIDRQARESVAKLARYPRPPG